MAFLQRNCLRQNREGLRRADKRKAGRVTAIMLCILMLAIPMAGCGKVEEPIPVDLSDGNMEEMQGDGAGKDADAKNDAAKEAAQMDADNVDAGKKAKQADSGSESAQETAADGQQTQDAQSVGSTQLEGDVRSVDADSFVICKNETWEEDGYSYAVAVAPGNEEESDLITIHTVQNCVYQFKTVKNSGINPEDVSTRDGSFTDVKEGLGVTIRGSWQDDGSFLADSVVLMEIV